MTTSEINSSLIGRRVKGIFTGAEVTGTIIGIVDEPYSRGVTIALDSLIQWGDEFYTKYTSTARIYDDWGNLSHTQLID